MKAKLKPGKAKNIHLIDEEDGEYGCFFCVGHSVCGVTSEGVTCTRKQGHMGDHVACAFNKEGHYGHRWRNRKK